jgi:phage terminase large subunit GpA-like protein
MGNGYALAVGSFVSGLESPEEISVSEWADRHRVLSKSTSAEPTRWSTTRTPYLREIMNVLSASDPTQQVVFMKPTQIGGTEAGNNWIGTIIDQAGGPTMIVLPTTSAAKKSSKTRITPMIQDTPCLRGKVREAKSRGSGNTTLLKEFDGGVLIFAGSNSATDLKSSPVRNLFLDEIEEYPSDVDGQGDPEELAQKRTDTFPRRKIFKVSSPTIVDGRIHRAYRASDQRLYNVPCPHCGRLQALRWAQMRWETRKVWEIVDKDGVISPATATTSGAKERDTGELQDVWYECEQCNARIDEHHKPEMLAGGQWIAQNPGPDRAAGFKISALYSPIGWVSWRQVVLAWLEAGRDASGVKIKTFTNTVLGEAYEEQGEVVDEHILKRRIEGYRLSQVPKKCLLLTAGVDVQGDRLECYVWGFGRDEETWLIDRHIIYGPPAEARVWTELEDVLAKVYNHESGSTLRITAMAIDASDGNTTHAVRNFARKWAPSNRVLAVKGQAISGKPIIGRPTFQDVSHRGQIIKDGVRLWPVGADTAKGWIYGHLRITSLGAGFVHLPAGLPDEFFTQLTSERRVTRYIRGRPQSEWTLERGRRNEALDCAVYALAAAYYAGLTRVNWDAMERQVIVNQRGLFEESAATEPGKDAVQTSVQDTVPKEPLLPKRKNWVTQWR